MHAVSLPPTVPPPPAPADALATAWIARRARVSPAVAIAIRELTGLGAPREGVR